jgi:hypothetical protein
VALVVAPAGGVHPGHRSQAVEERAADQAHPLAEDRPAGEGEEGPTGALEIGAKGVGVVFPEPFDLAAAVQVLRDGGEQGGFQDSARLLELRRGDPPAVVDRAAEGDQG